MLPLGNIYFNRGQTYQQLDKKKEELEQEMNKTESSTNLDLFTKFNRVENDLFAKLQEWENATEELEGLKKSKIELLKQ